MMPVPAGRCAQPDGPEWQCPEGPSGTRLAERLFAYGLSSGSGDSERA